MTSVSKGAGTLWAMHTQPCLPCISIRKPKKEWLQLLRVSWGLPTVKSWKLWAVIYKKEENHIRMLMTVSCSHHQYIKCFYSYWNDFLRMIPNYFWGDRDELSSFLPTEADLLFIRDIFALWGRNLGISLHAVHKVTMGILGRFCHLIFGEGHWEIVFCYSWIMPLESVGVIQCTWSCYGHRFFRLEVGKALVK